MQQDKGTFSDFVFVSSVIRQGYILLPILFNIVLDDVMTKVSETGEGIRWFVSFHLKDLEYADNIYLFSHMFDNSHIREAQAVGLTINIKKTKTMEPGSIPQERFNINNNQLVHDVESFLYLRSIVSNTGVEKNIQIGINKTQYLRKSTKFRIFKSNATTPILLY